jgi:hypothetical protein
MNVKWGMAKFEKQKVVDITSARLKTKSKIAELESREKVWHIFKIFVFDFLHIRSRL